MKFSFAASVLALATPAAAFSASYLDTIGGASSGSAPAMGGGAASYLSGLTSSGSAAPSGAGMGSYLDNMSGSSAAAPVAPEAPAAPASDVVFSGFGQAFAPSAPTSAAYLDALLGSSTETTGSGLPGYLDTLPSESTPLEASAAPEVPLADVSFSGFGEASMPSAPTSGAYLEALLGSSTETSGSGLPGYLDTLRIENTPNGGGFIGYLDALRVETYNPVNVEPKTYVDTLKGAMTVTGKVASTNEYAFSDEANSPVLAAIRRLNENVMANQQATISILRDINTSVKSLADKAEMTASTEGVSEATELTSALEGQRQAAQAWSGQGWNP